MNLNFIKISFLSLLSVFTLVACSTDDDINDIFIGKTWYMSGGKLNGTDFTKDQVSSLYVNKDSYWIIFSQGTFTGKLSTNTSFSGNWEADGGHRRLTMNVTSSVNCEESVLDANIFRVIKNVTRYSGDSNILEIFSDDNSYINMGSMRGNK